MKAITITRANQDMLVSRFNLEPIDKNRQLPVGYILVTEFGNDETFDVITPSLFAKIFKKTGDIEHGFISIEKL
jgi:hypothetical protein